jgi:peptide/nickel transport system permease protein
MTAIDPLVVSGTGLPPAEGGEAFRQESNLKRILYTFVENRLAVVGVFLVIIVSLFCFVGPHIYHTDQVDSNLVAVNLKPTGSHLLGTDDSGHDILGRLMVGGQVTIEIAFAVALITTVIGVLYGAVAGYYGKVVDTVMMRFVDILLAIPVVYLFIFLSTVFKPTKWLLVLVLSGLSWLGPARLIRGETLSLRTREYVQAVKSMGGRSWRIIIRHIVPNTIGTIIVNATFQVADAILILAVLDYLGFSLPPTVPTWGSMLSDGTNFLLDGYWWQVYPAMILLVLTVVAFNLIGDGLRDSFEVRLQKR